MRDYANKQYPQGRENSKKTKNKHWITQVPAWAWLVFGIFTGYGLANVPLLSNLKSSDNVKTQLPSFDDTLAQEIQDLKARNEAANKALKEDLANIKKASIEAGAAAKQAVKQAQITAGQIEKSVENQKKQLENQEKAQALEDSKKANQADKDKLAQTDASAEDSQKTSLDTADLNDLTNKDTSQTSDQQANKPDTKNLEVAKKPVEKSKTSPKFSQEIAANQADKAKEKPKNKSENRDTSLDFDFYELLPESEVRVETSSEDSKKSTEISSYILQVGSFRTEKDANRHKAKLDKLKLGDSKIVKAQMHNDSWYRVYLGPYNSRRAATQMQNKLAQNGFEALQLKLK